MLNEKESFAIAAFRSRSSVQRLEMQLRRLRIPCSIISTPRDVSLGCGLSVRFEINSLPIVMSELQKSGIPNLIGFYTVERQGYSTRVTPVRTNRFM
ncbi:MAG: DUF3343 domain-containing protein [Clostridiales bacterium]|nr:DUF3343 domain-containing protein [Clostridiales bacterium]MBQ2816966.1 DUF3343 domain-containing protein [Clostridia bacterium]MBQ4637372.1 DUF3343 domain-containing protein [Clostridia bacterium]